MDSYNSPTTKPLYRGAQTVWYILGLLEAILAFRFAIKFFAANPAAGFTDFIYTISHPFVAPFISVFRNTRMEGSVMEWTTILAMLVYWFFGWAIIRLFFMSKTVSTPEAAAKLESKDPE